jgi:multidrug efflux pump subunit AcrA (membrane-fusion protein)
VLEFSDFVGSLESRLAAPLRPEIAGRISNIFVNPGDRVQTGDPIIRLKPNKQQADLESSQAGVQSANASVISAQKQLETEEAQLKTDLANLDLQQAQYRRTKTLVDQGALARQQLDILTKDLRSAQAAVETSRKRIEQARASRSVAESELNRAKGARDRTIQELGDTTIVAPFDGMVGDIPVKLGQVVSSSDTLSTVTQNDSLDLRLAVPLERSADLRISQRVELLNNAEKRLTAGRISFISPQVNENAQSVLAKATFANKDGKLRSGQFVRARVIWQERPGVLIPTAAISRLGSETFVYVAQPLDEECKKKLAAAPSAAPPGAPAPPPPELIARQRPVQLGRIQDNRYQILKGIEPDERVIVSGVLNLSDCAAVLPQNSAPPGQQS